MADLCLKEIFHNFTTTELLLYLNNLNLQLDPEDLEILKDLKFLVLTFFILVKKIYWELILNLDRQLPSQFLYQKLMQVNIV